MDQKELKQLENQCIQTEPPFCKAACPFHVDVKRFMKHINEGDVESARIVLDATLPFSDILGRICDHPCEAVCRRKEAGGPIAIHALERAVVTSVPSKHKTIRLPRKFGKIAVTGGGLSSMTVSWDLGRKGYEVVLYTAEESIGGLLHDVDERTLPEKFLQEAHHRLLEINVTVKTHADLNPDFLSALPATFDAIYIGFDSEKEKPAYQSYLRDFENTDPLTRQTSDVKIFSGGMKPQLNAHRSWITDAAQGRWAAVSIDRFLQKVSLVAARENQGPFQSRLFTDISPFAPEPPVLMKNPDNGYTIEEAEEEANRCMQCECMVCVRACTYLKYYGGYPKIYIRKIYNNDLIVLGTRSANLFINSCSLCGLCEAVCPEKLYMGDVCKNARFSLVQNGKMPPRAHEFALQDMAFANSHVASLFKGDPKTKSTEYLFFPGCQLSAISPMLVEAAYAYLRETLNGGVGIALSCCGSPAGWAGRDDLAKDTLKTVSLEWNRLGNPKVITTCPTCDRFFRHHLPEIPLVTLWALLNSAGLPKNISIPKLSGPLALHDPCTARHATHIQNSVRTLLKTLGISIEELSYSRNFTKCCGFGGLMSNANPDLAKEVAHERAFETSCDMVTYCAMCQDSLAATGKRVIYLLELIFDRSGSDPALKPRPSLSLRRENRAYLKRQLSQTLWSEKSSEPGSHKKILLNLSDAIIAKMEAIRVLDDDIQRVIYHGEQSGNKLYNPNTKRFLTYYSPARVTFWVEYSPDADGPGFTVHNIYSHRMKIVQGDVK